MFDAFNDLTDDLFAAGAEVGAGDSGPVAWVDGLADDLWSSLSPSKGDV